MPDENEGGDSLLLEYRIRPQAGLISRQNGFTFSPGILLDFMPMFRVFSLGGDLNSDGVVTPDELLFPDQGGNDARARCADGPSIVGGGTGTFGNNSRYFALFDYVKTTTRIASPRLPAVGTSDPEYFPALVQTTALPAGSTVSLEYGPTSSSVSSYDPDPSAANGNTQLSVRVTLVANRQTREVPTVTLVAVPYKK